MTTLTKFDGVRDLLREESFQVFVDGQEDLFVRTFDLENGVLRVNRLMTQSGAGLQRFREAREFKLRIDLETPFELVLQVDTVTVDELSLGQLEHCFDGEADDDCDDETVNANSYAPTPRSPPSITFRANVVSSSF